MDAEVKGTCQEARSHTDRLGNEFKQSELPVSSTKSHILELDYDMSKERAVEAEREFGGPEGSG